MSFPLSHLSSNDQALFRQFGFGSTRVVPTPIVHHAFQKHAREQPEVIAVEHASMNESITYQKLDTQSNRLAHRLRKQDIRPGSLGLNMNLISTM